MPDLSSNLLSPNLLSGLHLFTSHPGARARRRPGCAGTLALRRGPSPPRGTAPAGRAQTPRTSACASAPARGRCDNNVTPEGGA
eukprot:712607-Prorocentrum_minimum.AAC.1